MTRARTRTRTRKGPEELRGDLLAAAAALFAQRGFSNVSIADVTAKAGVAAGTFYRYFPSKDVVLVELRRAVLDELLQRVGAVLADGNPNEWWTAAEAMIDSTLRFWFENPARSKVVLRGDFTDDAAEVEAALWGAYTSGIAIGQRRGVVNADIDPEVAAGFLLHGATGLVYHAIIDGKVADADTIVAEVTKLAHHLLDPR